MRALPCPSALLSQAPLGALCPALGSQQKKHMDLLELIQRRVTKVLRGLGHLCCEERLRKLRLFTLERKGFWGGP